MNRASTEHGDGPCVRCVSSCAVSFAPCACACTVAAARELGRARQRGRSRRTLRRVISSDGEQADLRIFQATWARKRTEPMLFQCLRKPCRALTMTELPCRGPRVPSSFLPPPSCLRCCFLQAAEEAGGVRGVVVSRGCPDAEVPIVSSVATHGEADEGVGLSSRLSSGLRRRPQAL